MKPIGEYLKAFWSVVSSIVPASEPVAPLEGVPDGIKIGLIKKQDNNMQNDLNTLLNPNKLSPKERQKLEEDLRKHFEQMEDAKLGKYGP